MALYGVFRDSKDAFKGFEGGVKVAVQAARAAVCKKITYSSRVAGGSKVHTGQSGCVCVGAAWCGVDHSHVDTVNFKWVQSPAGRKKAIMVCLGTQRMLLTALKGVLRSQFKPLVQPCAKKITYSSRVAGDPKCTLGNHGVCVGRGEGDMVRGGAAWCGVDQCHADTQVDFKWM